MLLGEILVIVAGLSIATLILWALGMCLRDSITQKDYQTASVYLFAAVFMISVLLAALRISFLPLQVCIGLVVLMLLILLVFGLWCELKRRAWKDALYCLIALLLVTSALLIVAEIATSVIITLWALAAGMTTEALAVYGLVSSLKTQNYLCSIGFATLFTLVLGCVLLILGI